MITKEEFVSIMNTLEKKQEQQLQFCDAIENLTNNTERCDVLIYTDMIDITLDLLERIMKDENQIISGKFYLLDNCKKKYQVMSWEELYDFLIKVVNK